MSERRFYDASCLLRIRAELSEFRFLDFHRFSYGEEGTLEIKVH